jgi:antitoxin VapB
MEEVVILNIKNNEAHRLATALAEKTGESLTQAVIVALRERLMRQRGKAPREDLLAEVMEIGKRCAALPEIDTRTPDEIIGYDEFGIPR